jgi:hypothetical protein
MPLKQMIYPKDRYVMSIPRDMFSTEIVNALWECNLVIASGDIFISRPGITSKNWHIDGRGVDIKNLRSQAKLNFIVDETSGDAPNIFWADIKADYVDVDLPHVVDTNIWGYKLIDNTQIIEIGSVRSTGWSLMEVGLPHAGVNFGHDGWRWNYSFKLIDRDWQNTGGPNWLTVHEALRRLAPYIA